VEFIIEVNKPIYLDIPPYLLLISSPSLSTVCAKKCQGAKRSGIHWQQAAEYSFALFSSTHPTPDTLSNMSSQTKEPRRSEREKKKMTNPPKKPSAQHLFNQIRRIIITDRKRQCLTFENVDPEAGSLIVDSLNEDGVVESLRPRYYHSLRLHLTEILLTDHSSSVDSTTIHILGLYRSLLC
jgi:hypothetical protein